MRLISAGLVGLALVGMGVAVLDEGRPAPDPITPRESSSGQVQEGRQRDLTVWYLGHCGFAVRSGDRLLIFDYQQQYGTSAPDGSVGGLEDGIVHPEDLEGLEVYVFTTHSHSDHYDPSILEWAREAPGIHYFFGWEAGSDPNHHYLVGPRATASVDGMEIYTINSHHSGVPEVAYLVQVDGNWIYHNGDYRQEYVADFEYLAGLTDRLDLAFHAGLTMPGHYMDQTQLLMERFSPGAYFPLHYSDEEAEKGEAFARFFQEEGYEGFIAVPRARGDRWEF